MWLSNCCVACLAHFSPIFWFYNFHEFCIGKMNVLSPTSLLADSLSYLSLAGEDFWSLPCLPGVSTSLLAGGGTEDVSPLATLLGEAIGDKGLRVCLLT